MHKEPLIRIVKKQTATKTELILTRVIAIVISIILSSIFILMMEKNPLEVFSRMFLRPLYKSGPPQVIEEATTLIIIGLGISLAFKMKFWNIGAEGQILFGAIGATFFALNFPHWPSYILLPVMLLASFITGGLYGLIPAFFKAKYKTNETLFTLMMNYIAVNVVKFLESSIWKDPNVPVNRIANFSANALIPKMSKTMPWRELHAGWILAVILLVLVYIYLRKTKSGYEICVVGESESTARYAGMDVKKIIMKTMFISAGLCGIAGFIQAAGANSTLSSSITGGMGFTAIIIVWLAHLNPLTIMLVSLLFSIMRTGSGMLQSLQITPAASEFIQGIILFCVLGCEFFINYKVIIRGRNPVKIAKESETK